jgi:gliding motility-associated-like protein
VAITASSNVLCFGASNGTATAAATGGSSPYSFAWSNGQTGSTATGLAAGSNYDVTITDAAGCQISTVATVGSPAQLQVSNMTTQDVTCRGSNDGRISAVGTGGTAPYSFRWSNNQTTAVATGLIAGLYSITITDANGCTAIAQAQINQPTQSLSIFLNATPTLCAGEPTGQVVAVPGGGTPLAGNSYLYQWSNGASTRILSGIGAGSYSVTVTDANGCTIQASQSVADGGTVQIQAQVLQQVTCLGGSDGRANAVANSSNGGAVSLIWSTGATTNNVTGLSAGTYGITASDGSGCSSTTEITINDGLAVQAQANIQNVGCFGGTNGAIQVVSSPVGFLYEWSNGLVANDGNISNLAAGIYTVTISIPLGCRQAFTYSVEQPTELQLGTTTTSEVLCFGGNQGGVVAAVVGGTAPYGFAWSNGGTDAGLDSITAGTYTLLVTDANGCTINGSISLSQPDELSLEATGTGTTCTESEDGAISVNAEGGTSNLGLYEYSVDGENWQSGNLFPNLAAGAYTAFVRDANGCTDSAVVNVDAADPFFIVSLTALDSITFGDTSNIEIVLNDTTGATFFWAQTGANGGLIDSALAIQVAPMETATYAFTATNANGCQLDTTVTIEVAKPRFANAPLGFTPNGDGVNDQFFIQGDDARVSGVRVLRVYDRWGELVFDGVDMTLNDGAAGWDGTFRGKNSASGIYAWYAEVEFIDGFILVLKGDITLLR